MHDINTMSLTLDQLIRATREIQYCRDLVPAQWEPLRFLSQANKYSLTPSMVANFLGTTKGTASQTLRSLEKKGISKENKARPTNLSSLSPHRSGPKQAR